MNNAVFGKIMENIRKHKDIKLVAIDKKSNCLMSELKYDTTKWFSENLLAIETKKNIKVNMSKPVLDIYKSILEISKTLIYEFWYNNIGPNYQQNTKLCYMDTVKCRNIYMFS